MVPCPWVLWNNKTTQSMQSTVYFALILFADIYDKLQTLETDTLKARTLWIYWRQKKVKGRDTTGIILGLWNMSFSVYVKKQEQGVTQRGNKQAVRQLVNFRDTRPTAAWAFRSNASTEAWRTPLSCVDLKLHHVKFVMDVFLLSSTKHEGLTQFSDPQIK